MAHLSILSTKYSYASLTELQEYLRTMSIKRGFTKESAQNTLLVMLEEVGELAKAIRKHSGIGIDHQRLDSYGNLKHEMADVLICLLILANKCDVNIFDAFHDKEKINSQRTWSTATKVAKSTNPPI